MFENSDLDNHIQCIDYTYSNYLTPTLVGQRLERWTVNCGVDGYMPVSISLRNVNNGDIFLYSPSLQLDGSIWYATINIHTAKATNQQTQATARARVIYYKPL